MNRIPFASGPPFGRSITSATNTGDLEQRDCRNPLRGGASFRTEYCRNGQKEKVMPSQSPSRRGLLSDGKTQELNLALIRGDCRNPLRVGASFRTMFQKTTAAVIMVAIPFASGPPFGQNLSQSENVTITKSQSPSRRGLLSDLERLVYKWKRHSGLKSQSLFASGPPFGDTCLEASISRDGRGLRRCYLPLQFHSL